MSAPYPGPERGPERTKPLIAPQEIDHIWNAFLDKGSVLTPLDRYEWSEKYGWINDGYGISWQLALGKTETVGQRLTPCLLFTGDRYGKAEEAIEY